MFYCFKRFVGSCSIRNNLCRLELQIGWDEICLVTRSARVDEHVTSVPNMRWEKYTKMQYPCRLKVGILTSWLPSLLFCDSWGARACGWCTVPQCNLSKQHGLEQINLPTCSTHVAYKLVALTISNYSYFFFWRPFRVSFGQKSSFAVFARQF